MEKWGPLASLRDADVRAGSPRVEKPVAKNLSSLTRGDGLALSAMRTGYVAGFSGGDLGFIRDRLIAPPLTQGWNGDNQKDGIDEQNPEDKASHKDDVQVGRTVPSWSFHRGGDPTDIEKKDQNGNSEMTAEHAEQSTITSGGKGDTNVNNPSEYAVGQEL